MLAEAGSDPEVRRIMADPYGLNPEGQRRGPDGPTRRRPPTTRTSRPGRRPSSWRASTTRWCGAATRCSADAYGAEFRYDEAMLMGDGPAGWLKAAGLTAGLGAAMGAGAIGPLRSLLERFLPAPGEGPSKEEREAGFFDLRFYGEHPEDPARACARGSPATAIRATAPPPRCWARAPSAWPGTSSRWAAASGPRPRPWASRCSSGYRYTPASASISTPIRA